MQSDNRRLQGPIFLLKFKKPPSLSRRRLILFRSPFNIPCRPYPFRAALIIRATSCRVASHWGRVPSVIPLA